MGQKKLKEQQQDKSEFIFGKRNYKFMFIGLACIALGFILMSGGGSDDPNVFKEDIFNFRRIRLAPTLVLIGFGFQIYAIITGKGKSESEK
jgi:hypothetical protein